ncbi:PucR family transcriptional regulator [[Mycobacterium] burgundiense]|uniref:Helix-turn-helix domain-containing protein n=1 Tax=[Mycobacterium] burgundiense TaxID=3064286 RepID=A0ABM9LFU6_9MYCO|nr:PucR family transcriptional regulator [Mycolicibacterium sp. MU0053]CAJ1498308.1 helix-turn-helix domain-containing protein [Mycolicibacterium sp. MU0053]
MTGTGVSLGQLLLALDATLVNLVEAPRGLDLPVASAALIDADDVRLGLAVSAGSADVFFLLGVAGDEALGWIDRQTATTRPTAIFVKEPGSDLVRRAAACGVAVVAVEPRARWERVYRLVNHVFDHHGDRADPHHDSGTDLFGLAQSIAERTHGMVSIEDAQSHVLAYSASNDEADELRRLSILGRAGPPEHLRWLAQWGIFDALRSDSQVVRVQERPELGLRPRRAIGIHQPAADRRHAPVFGGTIWVQQGSRPLAEDADEVLHGAAVLAARIIARLAATPSTHALRVQELLGLRRDGTADDPAATARELGIAPDGRAAVVGVESAAAQPRLADVLALSASAFHRDAQVSAVGQRVYVLFPEAGRPAAVTSWVRGVVASLRTELGLELRAVIAAPVAGLAQAAAARVDIDRVLDSAGRHPDTIGQVSSLVEARTTVVLDEIVTWLAANAHLVDSRVGRLDSMLTETLRAYLDSFGDVAAAARWLHVHPNTVRYRVRRIEQVLGTSLADPDVRLLLALSLRALDQ